MKTNPPNLIFKNDEVTIKEIERYMARGMYLRSQFISRRLRDFWRRIALRPGKSERPCRKNRVVLRYCHPQGKP